MLVTYYRTVLKQRGELVFDVPATHEFDVGRFREETMAFPPGVTVKDFESAVSQGYPNPKPGGAARHGSRRSFRSCRSRKYVTGDDLTDPITDYPLTET